MNEDEVDGRGEDNRNFLCFGDVINLRNESENNSEEGFMVVVPFVNSRAFIKPVSDLTEYPKYFRRSLFKVLPVGQNVAFNLFRSKLSEVIAQSASVRAFAKKIQGVNPEELDDPVNCPIIIFLRKLKEKRGATLSKKESDTIDKIISDNLHLANLESKLENLLLNVNNERERNKENLRIKEGNIVTYGESIQLLHLESGKVLIADKSIVSDYEKDCMKVSVEYEKYVHEGNHFIVMPRYKTRTEGAKVILSDSLLLINKTLCDSTPYLYASQMTPFDPIEKANSLQYLNSFECHSIISNEKITNESEISCSSRKMAWKIKLYQRAKNRKDYEVISSGEVVQLSLKEFGSQIQLSKNISYDYKSFEDKVVAFPSKDNEASCLGFWRIERASVNDSKPAGDDLKMRSKIVIRNLVTESFLQLAMKTTSGEEKNAVDESKKKDASIILTPPSKNSKIASSSSQSKKDGGKTVSNLSETNSEVEIKLNKEKNNCVFVFVDSNDMEESKSSKFKSKNGSEEVKSKIKLKNGVPLWLKSYKSPGLYLSIVEENSLVCNESKGEEISNLSIMERESIVKNRSFERKLTATTKMHFHSAIFLQKVPTKELNEISFALETVPYLNFISGIFLQGKPLNLKMHLTLNTILLDLNLFCFDAETGGSYIRPNIQDIYRFKPSMNPYCQLCLFNLGVINSVVAILKFASDKLKSGQDIPPSSLERETYRICTSLLYRSYQNNIELQNRAADHFHDGKLIMLLRLHIGMSYAVYYLLEKNKELLLLQVSDSWIEELVSYIFHEPSATYVDMLSRLVDFQGTAVQANQLMICEKIVLFDRKKRFILPFYKKGNNVYTKLSVNVFPIIAQSKEISESGELEILLEDLTKNYNDCSKFLVSSLILVSSLCAGRNYTVIDAFRSDFEQDILISVFQNSRIDSSIRAAMCRLYVNMYIDVAPNRNLKIPCYVKLGNALNQSITDVSNLKIDERKITLAEALKKFTIDPFNRIMLKKNKDDNSNQILSPTINKTDVKREPSIASPFTSPVTSPITASPYSSSHNHSRHHRSRSSMENGSIGSETFLKLKDYKLSDETIQSLKNNLLQFIQNFTTVNKTFQNFIIVGVTPINLLLEKLHFFLCLLKFGYFSEYFERNNDEKLKSEITSPLIEILKLQDASLQSRADATNSLYRHNQLISSFTKNTISGTRSNNKEEEEEGHTSKPTKDKVNYMNDAPLTKFQSLFLNSKLKIIEIFSVMYDMKLDNYMNDFFDNLNRSKEADIAESLTIEEYVTNILSPKILAPILLELIGFDNGPLVNPSVSFLIRLYSQRSIFQKSLTDSIFLTNSEFFDRADEIEMFIMVFEELIDQSELWMECKDENQLKQIKAGTIILEQLASYCATEENDYNIKPNPIIQNIVTKLGGHLPAVKFLDMIINDKGFSYHMIDKKEIKIMVQNCCKFLIHFCAGNESNQLLLSPFIAVIMKLSKVKMHSWNKELSYQIPLLSEPLLLLIEIHRDNFTILSQIKESLVVEIVECLVSCDTVNRRDIYLLRRLEKNENKDNTVDMSIKSPQDSLVIEENQIENKMPLLIQLLATFIVCKSACLKTNQNFILNKILDIYGYAKVKELLYSSTFIYSKNHEERGVSILKKYGGKLVAIKYSSRLFRIASITKNLRKSNSGEDAEYDSVKPKIDKLLEDQISINIHLIRLFTFCTYGKNTGTECKIQSLMDLNTVAEMIDQCVNSDASNVLKSTLVQFFFNCWLDTDNHVASLFVENSTWKILSIFEKEIKKWVSLDKYDERKMTLKNYIYDDIFACIDSFTTFIIESVIERQKEFDYTNKLDQLVNLHGTFKELLLKEFDYDIDIEIRVDYKRISSVINLEKMDDSKKVYKNLIIFITTKLQTLIKYLKIDDSPSLDPLFLPNYFQQEILNTYRDKHYSEFRKVKIETMDTVIHDGEYKAFEKLLNIINTSKSINQSIELEREPLIQMFIKLIDKKNKHSAKDHGKNENSNANKIAPAPRDDSLVNKNVRFRSVVTHVISQQFVSLMTAKSDHLKFDNHVPVILLLKRFLTQSRKYMKDRIRKNEKDLLHEHELKEVKNFYFDSQFFLNQCGASLLIVNVLRATKLNSIPDEIITETLKFGNKLLKGGNLKVQETIFRYFKELECENFFLELRERIRKAREETIEIVKFSQSSHFFGFDDDVVMTMRSTAYSETNLQMQSFKIKKGFVGYEKSNIKIVLKFLQLLCEGHNADMQNYLRHQIFSTSSFDLLSEVVDLWIVVSSHLFPLNVQVCISLANTIIEFCQGLSTPCRGNQDLLCTGQFIDSIIRILRINPQKEIEAIHPKNIFYHLDKDVAILELFQLQSVAISLLFSIFEGRNNDPYIFQTISKAIHGRNDIHQMLAESSGFNKYRHDRTVRKGNIQFFCHVINETLAESQINFDNEILNYVKKTKKIKELPSKLELESLIACKLYILFSNLVPFEPEIGDIMRSELTVETKQYFRKHIGNIEIQRKGMLEAVFFIIPEFCHYLPENRRHHLRMSMNRESHQQKLKDLLFDSHNIMIEMKCEFQLHKQDKWQSLSAKYQDALQLTNFVVIFCINIIMFVDIKVSVTAMPGSWLANSLNRKGNWVFNDPFYFTYFWTMSFSGFVWLRILGVLTFILTSARLYFTLKKSLPQAFQKTAIKMSKRSEVGHFILKTPPPLSIFQNYSFHYTFMYFKTFLGEVFKTHLISRTMYELCSFLGLFITPFFFSMNLMEIVYFTSTLQQVLKAISFNSKQLLTTFLLIVFTTYILTVMGFSNIQSEYKDSNTHLNMCENILECFATHVQNGFYNGGGGIGLYFNYLPNDQYGFKFLFSFLFFVFIVVIELNIILGIIIDTFSSLREKRDAAMSSILNQCEICGIEKFEFERYGKGFRYHSKYEHNIWMYLYYLVYLKTIKKDDQTGIDAFVTGLIEEGDISFFPVNKAMSLGSKITEK